MPTGFFAASPAGAAGAVVPVGAAAGSAAGAAAGSAAGAAAAAGASAPPNCLIAACVAGPIMPSALIFAPLAIKSCCCFITAGSGALPPAGLAVPAGAAPGLPLIASCPATAPPATNAVPAAVFPGLLAIALPAALTPFHALPAAPLTASTALPPYLDSKSIAPSSVCCSASTIFSRRPFTLSNNSYSLIFFIIIPYLNPAIFNQLPSSSIVSCIGTSCCC